MKFLNLDGNFTKIFFTVRMFSFFKGLLHTLWNGIFNLKRMKFLMDYYGRLYYFNFVVEQREIVCVKTMYAMFSTTCKWYEWQNKFIVSKQAAAAVELLLLFFENCIPKQSSVRRIICYNGNSKCDYLQI